MTGTREKISFEAFSYYSFQNPGNGYGGMNWVSMYTFGAGYINRLGYCDTGYNNALHGNVGAFTSPYSDGYGIFESADFKDPFNLKSMVAASAWNGIEAFTFNSYKYGHGQLRLKASDTIYVSQLSQTIDFGNYGRDFKNIVAVNILTGLVFNGYPGSYCTSGMGSYGYQMAFDNLKVGFANGIPVHQTGHHVLLPIQMLHHRHEGTIAGYVTNEGSAQHSGHARDDSHVSHHADSPYHSQLLSLEQKDGPPIGQFHLPAVEHFGS